jgi:hypothetical protein
MPKHFEKPQEIKHNVDVKVKDEELKKQINDLQEIVLCLIKLLRQAQLPIDTELKQLIGKL